MMLFMICILSTTEAIVPVVKSLEWSRDIVELHCKAGISTILSIGVVPSSVTTSMSFSILCDSKTASMGGVLFMKSRRWWHPLGVSVVGHLGSYSSWHVLWRKGWYKWRLSLGWWWNGHVYHAMMVHVHCCGSFDA